MDKTSFSKTTAEIRVSDILLTVGIPPQNSGYAFLRSAVLLAMAEPEILRQITKRLYPAVAVKYNTTAGKVERAMRHAIEIAWNSGRINALNTILGVNWLVGDKPTNGEFIALISDRLLQEEHLYEKNSHVSNVK